MKRTFKLTLLATTILVVQNLAIAAQDIIIDGTNKNQDDILNEFIFDVAKYDGKTVQIDNFVYYEFGTKAQSTGFYKCNAWFRDPMTFSILQSYNMYSYSFYFAFQPNTPEGKKYCMDLNNQYYTAPKNVSLKGEFVSHTLNTGKTLYFFLVEELTINSNTYTGSIPRRITE